MAKQCSPRLKAVAVGIAALGAMSAATQAQAYVYASSTVEVQNLSIVVNGLDNTRAPTYSFSATNTATLNGSSAPTQSGNCIGALGVFTTCGAAPTVLDPLAANAPGGTVTRANNNFSYLGPNGSDSFANSDSLISSAQLVTFAPTATRQIAETLLNTNGTARANSEITSNTSLFWTFSTNSTSGSLVLDFDANPQLRAAILELTGGFYDAQANVNASFTLTRTKDAAGADASGTVRWAPAGTTGAGNNDCVVSGLTGVSCAEDNDSLLLNGNRSTGVNPSNQEYRYGNAAFGDFGITIRGLQAGDYSLALNIVTSSIITRIPEPGTLALLGLGSLASFGLAARRRRREANA